MSATQPASDRQGKRRQQVRALARYASPGACACVLVADAPGIRQLADNLRQSQPLPPELTAGLFGFAVGMICGFALCHPPKE